MKYIIKKIIIENETFWEVINPEKKGLGTIYRDKNNAIKIAKNLTERRKIYERN